MHHHGASAGTGAFSRDVSGLPSEVETPELRLDDGEDLELTIAPVALEIAGRPVRMLAYNGSIPGPTLRVRQGSEIVVHVSNQADVEATVHWHGLRLENRYDGVPHDTQKPIPVGGDFTYRVSFPDEGLYWYHPHIREDYTQDSGLYGNIVVDPATPDHFPPCDREVVLTLDDILIEDGQPASYDRAGPDHTAMGRFGNVLLIGGREDPTLSVARNEVVRLFLTNTANTRVFNVALPGGLMKLIGGDSGRYEREVMVEEVLLAPSERAIVDVLFERDGEVRLEHRTPDDTYVLATITVAGNGATSSAASFATLRENAELVAERARLQPEIDRAPDQTLAFVAEMDMATSEPRDDLAPDAPRFACPMDPEIVSVEPSRCPICGMKLLPIELVPAALERLADGGTGHDDEHGGAHHAGHAAGLIEWEDTMEDVNRSTNLSNMRWFVVDRATGKRNAEIDWSFTVGDRVKIRLVNEMASDHPMHHPFHIHGAGRFLVLTRDGVVEPNLVWKDTVLVKTGEVVDILLDVSNPGLWMAHCHIAEHAESGMMFSFNVAR